MFSKLVLVSIISFAAAAPQHQAAARFPAGVDPAACPGFPICDNARLHNPQAQQTGHWGAPAPAWNNPAPANHWDNPSSWNNPAPANNWDNPSSWNDQGSQWNNQDSQWNNQGSQWNNQGSQWNNQGSQWNAPALTGPAGNGLPAADKYPAGVNPQSCPNYPFCDNAAAGHGPQVAPLPGFTERQYPAGVSPHSCPNFPYCS